MRVTNGRHHCAMNIFPDWLDYARRREAQERAAAKQALTVAARRAHQELAQLHAQLGSRAEWCGKSTAS